MVRDVSEFTLTDEWYMDMVQKDQDDCSKRLICEAQLRFDRHLRVHKLFLNMWGARNYSRQ